MDNPKIYSEFAETLHTALKQSGFFYIPKLTNIKEIYNTYKNYSPKEMANKFAENYNLVETTVIYKMFQKMNNQELVRINETAKKLNVSPRLLSLTILDTPYISRTGKNKYTKYFWTNPEQPSMELANEFLQKMKEIKKIKVPEEYTNLIHIYVDSKTTFKDVISENRIPVKYHYQLERLFTKEKIQYNSLINKKPNMITEAKFKKPAEPKPYSEAPEILEDPFLKAKKDVTQMEYEILHQENIHLKLHIENLQNFIKYLKNTIKTLTSEEQNKT